jgi:predicted RNA-binding protein with PIN domain
MAPNRIWIMDGHNMIFAIAPLHQLQVSDRREEARSGLADRLDRFALARGEKVLIVFDGAEQPSNPEALRKPLLEIVYARRGEGAADDRIIREAARRLEQGLVVTVVTNDVSTLASKLPRGVRHLGVKEFWLKHIEKDVGDGGKRVEGDFSDVEREMMTRAALTEAVFEVRERVGSPARTGHGAAAASGPGTRPRAAAEESMRERILRKRKRGSLRQERRLKRRVKPEPPR